MPGGSVRAEIYGFGRSLTLPGWSFATFGHVARVASSKNDTVEQKKVRYVAS